MCTISIIQVPASDGRGTPSLRIVCNRDESRSRPPALPPRWRAVEGDDTVRAIWPMDMEGGGTWLGASERGLVLSLLNLNREPRFDPRGVSGLRSRGLVIPALLGAESAEAAARRLERMSLRHYAPFRLIAIGPSAEAPIAEASWDRTRLDIRWHRRTPLCFVSSGLGDHISAPRLELFDEMVAGPGATQERQDDFHRYTIPGRSEVGVLMSRPDARTVSITTVELSPTGVDMDYEAVVASTAVAS
jgi:hypothetical protein